MPLLEGYEYEFLPNRAKRPNVNFRGCNTPLVRERVVAREFDAWLIVGWNTLSCWQAMRACWHHGVPMLARGDSNLQERRPMYVRIAKRLILGRWIPRFSACLAVGTLNGEYLPVLRSRGAPNLPGSRLRGQ